MLTIKRKNDNRVVKCILHRVADIPGGVTVKVANLGGNALFEGTPLAKGANGLFEVIKTAQIITAYASGTSLEVAKGSHFKVNDYITPDGVNVAKITAIDKSNSAKDVFTLAAGFDFAIALGACIEGVAVESSKHTAVAYGTATASTSTSLKVKKGHKLAICDFIAGKAASKFVGTEIVAIAYGAAYDIVTVATAFSVNVAADDEIIVVKASGEAGATASNQKSFNDVTRQNAVCVAGTNLDVESDSNLFVDAWVIGVIHEANAPIVNDAIKSALSGIIYV